MGEVFKAPPIFGDIRFFGLMVMNWFIKQDTEVTMRLDKFLKVSRLIKRRTVANEACDAGRVTVNGRPAKASVNVKVGDIIEIAFGQKTVKVRVLNLLDTTKKEEAKDLFEYI